MKCKNCATEISPTTTDVVAHQPITCPACEAVFYAADNDKRIAPFTPSSRSLPAKMSIKVLNDELVITRHWRGVVRLGLLAVVSFLLTFGLFFSDMPTAMFLFNPLTWIVAALGYYGLKGLVNTTVVRVSPIHLSVKEGPLLPRRRIEIDSRDVTQLYVKQHVQRGRKNTTTTYQLHLVQENGEHEEIVSDLESADQALFLEQEIERFLGLEDQAVPDEQAAALPGDFTGWRTFAATNGLHYTYGKLLAGHRVHGLYQGYRVELVVGQPRLALTPQTRLTVAVADKKGHERTPANQLTLEMVTTLFAAPVQSTVGLTGKVNVTDRGKTFIYEEGEVKTEAAYLQVVFDTLVRLSEAYPHIIALGGAVMPMLHPIALDKKHPARAVATQLMKEIAPTTEHLASAEETLLLCPDCLVRSAAHKLDLGGLTNVGYYGCRQCHQSKNFLTIKTVVAVLDHQTEPEPVQQGQTLTVHWLSQPSLFDFDTIKIIDATDEEVERFAVQVGNDTDPVRQLRYKQIRCIISPDCKLSENTLRILRRMFGQVEIDREIRADGS
jgi:hypothetical protein